MRAYPLICVLFICLLTVELSAIEGVDHETGGDWNTPTTIKPWSYDGQNVYGTAGYHFFNVTELGGKKTPARPTNENLRSHLPTFIKSITPAEGSYTAHSFGYLGIDAKWDSNEGKVESGLLAKASDMSGDPMDLLTIQLGKIRNIYGFRIGVLIANTDRGVITPKSVSLRSKTKPWGRTIINLNPSAEGMWLFFTVSSKHANDSLILSVQPNGKHPANIGGLVFDELKTAPEAQPLNVSSSGAVTQAGQVIWDAATATEQPITIEDSWEHALAMRVLPEYRKNQSRIDEIQNELDNLPSQYSGEPTGTGGFLSKWSASQNNTEKIHFNWFEPVTIDAVALLPLRLFLADEAGLTDNAYWPGEIEIHAIDDEKSTLLSRIDTHSSQIQQSLPELVTFNAHSTQHLRITLKKLSKRIGAHQFAAGLSEVCIFSNYENVAPRAQIFTTSSREGFRVFSKNYLIDGHTPLGLPEIQPRKVSGLGLSIRPKNKQRIPDNPLRIRLNFENEIVVDAVRLDPAVIYKPGQAFPVRFSVELLGANNRIIHVDDTYKDTPLRNPGLNPHITYFPETRIQSIRVVIYEISQPTQQTNPWIQISEITPMLNGEHILSPVEISGVNLRKQDADKIIDPSGRQLYWRADTVYDGHTQSGSILPMRNWIDGLYKKKILLLENQRLESAQEDFLRMARVRTLWAAFLIVLLIVVLSLFVIIRSKVRGRRELRHARERIASDLHDDVGSNLGTITLHTEFLMDQLEAPDQVDHLKAIKKLTRESVYGLREVLHTSAPRIGRAQNILEYVEELGQLVLPDTKLQICLDPNVNNVLKTPEVRKGILLYYKEALTNIRSHAQCQHVSVSLSKENNHLELIIEDDGIGMPPEKLSRESTLRTLKLRAIEMQATLNIISKVDVGTRLELKIPLR